MKITPAATLLAVLSSGALAQPASSPTTSTPAATNDAARRTDVVSGSRRIVDPRWATLNKMMRPLTITFDENRLEDVLKFISEATGADLEIFWADDGGATGLDREKLISLKADRISALSILERVLDKAADSAVGVADGNTWQMADGGSMQVGTKSRLNKFRRLEIYDIHDLLFEITDKTNAPQFDLNQSLQSGQGGGGGSPFQQNNQNNNTINPLRQQQKSDEIKTLVTELVEPEQWIDNGGDGASISFWKNAFMINAPDYIHRQVGGYPYWPAKQTTSGTTNGRRWVTLNGTYQNSEIVDVRQIEAQGVVPGGR